MKAFRSVDEAARAFAVGQQGLFPSEPLPSSSMITIDRTG